MAAEPTIYPIANFLSYFLEEMFIGYQLGEWLLGESLRQNFHFGGVKLNHHEKPQSHREASLSRSVTLVWPTTPSGACPQEGQLAK